MKKRFKLAVLNSHPIQYFAPLYRHLAQEDEIELTVYYCSRQGVEEYVDEGFDRRVKWDVRLLEGYQYRFIPNLRKAGQMDGALTLINPGIVSELRRERFDALWVHGHNYATFWMAIGAARVMGIPVLMRGETHLLLNKSPFQRLVRRGALGLFYRFFCAVCLPIGTRNAEFYRYHGVSDDRLFAVPYTVNNGFFTEAIDAYQDQIPEIRRGLGVQADRPIILYASKMIPRKRPMDLLRAYQQVREQGGETSLLFVGDGSERKDLEEYVERCRVPDVVFHGFRNQSELPRFYAAADVFVLPSENEPWGLIINEVMCAGLPVIATEEVGAVADLVEHGSSGYVYRAGDVDALAGYLRRLVADENLRRKMETNTLKLIKKWDYERCVAGVREALEYVTGNGIPFSIKPEM